MDKGPKQTLDALYAQFDKILTKLGGILMLTGIPNNLLKTLETTHSELERIMKILEFLEKHTPEWLGGKPPDKPEEKTARAKKTRAICSGGLHQA